MRNFLLNPSANRDLIFSFHFQSAQVSQWSMDLGIIRLDGRYRLQRKVRTGSFGELNVVMLHPLRVLAHKHAGDIYLACDILSGQLIIIKLEPVNNKYQMLEHEFHVYRKLRGGVGIPEVHWFGTERGFNAMAMDVLGHSLEDLFIQCQFQFSIKTVVLLGRQLVSSHSLLFMWYHT